MIKNRKNTQAFWLVGEDRVPVFVERIKTLQEFAILLIKINMKENDFRFITADKKRFIRLWEYWFKVSRPQEYGDKSTAALLSTIANEIFTGYTILHRKNNGNIYLPEKPINSKYSRRVIYCIKKSLETMLKS